MPAHRKTIAEFIGNTPKSVENWEKENRYIVQFIRKYLNDDKLLEEFMKTGKIAKLEEKNIDNNFKKIILDDHMLHNAAYKLNILSSKTSKTLEILTNILKDIDPKDDSFTLDNAKQRLMDRVYGIEEYSIHKTEGIAKWIEKYLSKAEVFAMVKHPDTFIDLIQ